MASFKNIPLVDAKYEGGIKVYLESAEDVRIFSDHWFSHKQDKLRFVSAEDGPLGGGGCRVVISKVAAANGQAIKAYGIVDRDVLLADADALFWETDDAAFHAARPYGDKVHVLRRWELENYLLKPEAFAKEVARRVSREPVPVVSATTFLAQADDIVQVTALTTLSVANGKASPKPAFGTNLPPGSDLSQEIAKHLQKQALGADDLAEDVGKIEAFGRDCRSLEEKWDKLSRLLDGKKCLVRLCHYLSKGLGVVSLSHWEEVRGCLANNMASQIDQELLTFIDSIA
ncbi:hypothetical protein KFZ76_04175 [Methylovulum psychrotolerans]|uniref:hypothetical protein n=1 Tax=Methylovulum psychrotolerans TaxID=1704499 RepID=UPI001BFFC7A2|nr:hypothetical protein [Methylovulum psychrotolerans]MBT9096909.1 hypothetical protein [Methylovulum psychrotolerans]